jgi:hypothetical protein
MVYFLLLYDVVDDYMERRPALGKNTSGSQRR